MTGVFFFGVLANVLQSTETPATGPLEDSVLLSKLRLPSFSLASTAMIASAALLLGSIGLTGCGIGVETAAPTTIAMGSIHGVIHGGPNPVQQANVILWETTNSGYPSSTSAVGTTSIKLASTTTANDGSFSFTPGTYGVGTSPAAFPSCSSNQFLYITATGGLTGSNVANNQEVLMAALGSCSHFDNTTDEGNVNVFMNELSTIAAAYALGNFTYVNENGNTGNELVFVSAPANNAYGSGSCTVTSNYITSCVAAGLAHAFANAANLVDAVHYDGSTPTGLAYAVPPSNAAAIAPQALINALGNSLQACTNSAGGTATSTNCGLLFSYATLTGNTYGASANTPADELSAVINIAKSPANQASNIFLLGPAGGFFTPALTAAPTDWSLAIWYPVTLAGAAGTTSWPLGVALDANDNVYVLGQDIQTTPTGSQLAGFTSNGTASWTTGLNTLLCDPVNLAADANGYLWYANHEASTGTCGSGGAGANAGVYAFTSSSPTITSPYKTLGTALTSTSPNNVAIDRHNNVWMSRSSSSQSTYIFPPPYTSVPALPKYFIASIDGISVDASQNGWAFSATAAATGSLTVLPNQGTVAVPAYATSSGTAYQNAVVTSISGQTATSGASTGSFDSSGNAWVASNNVVSKVVPSQSASSAVTVPITSFVCGTTGTANCTTLSFNYTNTYTTAPFVTNQIGIASGFTSTKGATFNNNYFQTTSSSTLLLAKVTLCNTTGASGGASAPCTLALTTQCSNSNSIPCNGTSTTADAGSLTIYPVTNSFSSTTSIATTATNPSNIATDGANTLWLDDNTNAGSVYYVVPSTSVSQKLNPCYLPSAATSCQAGGMTYGGRLAIDSTGSVWTVSGTSSSLIQIIGSAAPTWPLLAYTNYGVEPQ